MRIGSLFAGIGGFDLAASWVGWTTAWYAENAKWPAQFMAQTYPGVPNLGDVKRIHWPTVPRVDVLCAGFPCQPSSVSGKRLGTEDPRWLWPDIRRAVGELRCDWLVAENVSGLLDVNGGRAFAEVLRDLAALGYDATWDCIPAGAIGAKHWRDRIWLVGHRADACGLRLQREYGATQGWTWPQEQFAGLLQDTLRTAVPAGTAGGMADGLPDRLHRLKALGNSIVPQVAWPIFQAIQSVTNGHS